VSDDAGVVLLFVYGTLRPAASASAGVRRLAERARVLGAATVPGRLYDLGRYPAARLDEAASGVVRGDLLALPADALPAIDAYEGFDPAAPSRGLFRRERCRAQLVAGPPPVEREAWVYVWNGDAPPGPLVPGGEWRPQPGARTRD
jgi:gamma-glutamylcyclotransferase (GGCT)/AIG2-like uncharacterized protein YtfP